MYLASVQIDMNIIFAIFQSSDFLQAVYLFPQQIHCNLAAATRNSRESYYTFLISMEQVASFS